jgi:ATP-dependent DNA ligase
LRRAYGAEAPITGGRCVLQSRRGTDLTRSFPDLAAAALQQIPEDTIVDGEDVVDIDGRVDFTELQKPVLAGCSWTA